MARRSYRLGSPGAKLTSDPAEATQTVASGLPVVLIGSDPGGLAQVLQSTPDRGGRERLLAVMVGDPTDPQVKAAAAEMAGELWPWVDGSDRTAGRKG